MKLSKLLLAIVGATVLLGAFVSTASAGRLSNSSGTLNATWTSMRFRGGLGTVDCEVILNGTLHSRSINKTAELLIGSITAGNVNRCSRGGATVLRETLPWLVTYDSFSGTLPNITGIRTKVIGAGYRVREPTFGIECLSRTELAEPSFGIYNRTTATGAIASATVGGTIRCGGSITGSLEGTSSAVSANTVTLI